MKRGLVKVIEVIRVQYGEQDSQFGELQTPLKRGKHPVTVSIHDGFWQTKYTLDEHTPIAVDLTERGFATWNIEYRRFNVQGGEWLELLSTTLMDLIILSNWNVSILKNEQM